MHFAVGLGLRCRVLRGLFESLSRFKLDQLIDQPWLTFRVLEKDGKNKEGGRLMCGVMVVMKRVFRYVWII